MNDKSKREVLDRAPKIPTADQTVIFMGHETATEPADLYVEDFTKCRDYLATLPPIDYITDEEMAAFEEAIEGRNYGKKKRARALRVFMSGYRAGQKRPTADQHAAGSVEAERAAFEAWSTRAAPAYGFDTDERGQYVSYPVHSGWTAWQARAALAGAKPVAAGELPMHHDPALVDAYNKGYEACLAQQCAASRPAEMTLERLRLAESALIKNGFKRLDDIWVAPSVDSRPAGGVADTDDGEVLPTLPRATESTATGAARYSKSTVRAYGRQCFNAGRAAATLAASAAQPAAMTDAQRAEAAKKSDWCPHCGQGWHCAEQEQKLRAAASAVQAGAVPDGWQLVPKKLTPEMDEAMSIARIRVGNDLIWADTLAAAPNNTEKE